MAIDPSVLAAIFPQATPPAQGVSVLLIATPPQLPPKIQGEVISIDKAGVVVIQTDAGEITIKTDLAVRIGQAVELKLPPPQLNAPPIATLIANIPVRPEAPVVQALPPPVLLDLAAQTDIAHGLPAQIAPTLPGYAAPTAIPPANTLFQLLGQEFPATLLQNPTAATASVLNNGKSVMAGGMMKPAEGMAAAPTTIDRVQILFLGSVEDAQTELASFMKAPQSHVESASSALSALAGNTIGTTATNPLGTITRTPVTAPLLAQLIGLTPQKLPVFEALSMPNMAASNSMAGGAKASIPPGAQIVLHAPVLMTAAEERGGVQIGAALMLRLPPAGLSPELAFAQETLPEKLPMLNQLLQDPDSVVTPEMAAHVREIVARPNSPQFATQIILNMLGFSKMDPAAVFSKKLVESLKPEQHSQLQKELQLLPTLARENAQNAEGMRFNFPVEMAGQMYMWQMTLRPPDYDGGNGSSGNVTDKPTRFILDFAMSQLGPMQMDGLSFAKSRRLDLIVRTTQPLHDNVKNELIVQSLSVFEKADLKGSIDFQTL